MAYRRPGEEHAEPLILADRELVDYTDEFMLTDDMFREETVGKGSRKRGTGRPYPHFSTAEVARFFFGKDPSWLRWRMKNDHFYLNGVAVGTKRDSTSGFRYYTLADIERMTHALGQMGALNGAEITTILIIVKNVAKLYGILR